MEQHLKRIIVLMLAAVGIALIATVTAQAQTQPLGDYARAVKKTKRAPEKSLKTYDNDNLPDAGKLSVVGPAATESPSVSDDKGDSSKKADDSAQMKDGQSSEDRQKAIADFKQKIDDQKGKVDLLSREVDVLQRELQVKKADFNSSTARTVQNPRGFDEEEAKYKQQIAGKQKLLDDAKAKLSGLQEQGRKEGVPNSAAE
jgi:hypothetical protein